MYRVFLLAGVAFGVSCTGIVQESPDPAGGTAPPGVPSGPGGSAPAGVCATTTAARIWRLSDEQYAAVVADLLPGSTVPLVSTPGRSTGEFINLADRYPVTGGLASSVRASAKAVAADAVKDLPRLLGCGAGQAQAACASAFVERFASRAFRRPLQAAEKEDLTALYAAGSDAATGLRLVIEGVLQSPSFLYRTELGKGGAAGQPVALDAYELATTLSFFLLNSIPDDELWRAAQDGSLARPDVFDKQAARLLQLPRVRANLARVFLKWVGLGAGVTTELAATDFPEYDEPLRASLLEESNRFLTDLIVRNGTFTDLLTSRSTFVDRRLAQLYGVTFPGASGFAAVTLPAGQRAGIITQGGVLTSKSRGHPVVIRGKFVRKELLCDDIPSPPPTVNTAQFSNSGLSERQEAQARVGDAVCGACHQLMDPIGLAFSQYDPLSRFSSKAPDGSTVDASTTLAHTDVDGPVNGAVELAQRLAGSARVRSCISSKMLSYVVGRELGPNDLCEQQRIAAQVQSGGGHLLDVMTAILRGPSFRYRLGGK
jgi:hypothetical protein